MRVTVALCLHQWPQSPRPSRSFGAILRSWNHDSSLFTTSSRGRECPTHQSHQSGQIAQMMPRVSSPPRFHDGGEGKPHMTRGHKTSLSCESRTTSTTSQNESAERSASSSLGVLGSSRGTRFHGRRSGRAGKHSTVDDACFFFFIFCSRVRRKGPHGLKHSPMMRDYYHRSVELGFVVCGCVALAADLGLYYEASEGWSQYGSQGVHCGGRWLKLLGPH